MTEDGKKRKEEGKIRRPGEKWQEDIEEKQNPFN